jgi:hypothetical protein
MLVPINSARPLLYRRKIQISPLFFPIPTQIRKGKKRKKHKNKHPTKKVVGGAFLLKFE